MCKNEVEEDGAEEMTAALSTVDLELQLRQITGSDLDWIREYTASSAILSTEVSLGKAFRNKIIIQVNKVIYNYTTIR